MLLFLITIRLAHAPLDYPNVILESILGGAFGAAYILSGFNISVPIIMHLIYVSHLLKCNNLADALSYARLLTFSPTILQTIKDFTTFLGSWVWGRNQIRKMMEEQEEKILHLKTLPIHEFEDIARTNFRILDLNRDGYISKDEFVSSVVQSHIIMSVSESFRMITYTYRLLYN